MPTIYHSDKVFEEYLNRNDGDVQAAKKAIKKAARDQLSNDDG